MLADYWRDAPSWLPSRLIVALASDLGLSASATSTALSRLAGRGVLEQSSAGRTSRYRFTEQARERLRIGMGQVSEFGSETREWDRTWTVVAFSVPESSREVRELLRSRLKWLGFAPLYGALWVSAWDTAAELEASCQDFGVDNHVIFRTQDDDVRGKSLIEAWDFGELRAQYTPFIDTYLPRARELDSVAAVPGEAFRLRTGVMDAWRAFPWSDPGLPAELLPRPFPLFEARRLAAQIYDSLADAGTRHAEGVVSRVAPVVAGEARAMLMGTPSTAP
jgi:phenylacetic acid degradation operon negative regulatory protein